MKFGVVTHVGENYGIIVSGEKKYKFSMTSAPAADVGSEVCFHEDRGSRTFTDLYAKDIAVMGVKDPVIADILARLRAVEIMLARTTSNSDLQRVIEEDRDFGDGGFGSGGSGAV